MSNLNLDDLFKNALDRPSAPVPNRVWSTIQTHLPKPWYLQAWVGWLVALLSTTGLMGVSYQLWDVQRDMQVFQSKLNITSRVDTVVISRVDTLYIVSKEYIYAGSDRIRPGINSMEDVPKDPHSRDFGRQNVRNAVSPNAVSVITNLNQTSLTGKGNTSPAKRTELAVEERQITPSPAVENSNESTTLNSPSSLTEEVQSIESKEPEKGSEPSDQTATVPVDKEPRKTKLPITSDVRMIFSPAVSTQGSWSIRWAAEWEIRKKWGLGAGFQPDFFPEIEYDRVLDFSRVYGRPPNQMYPELADITDAVQQNMEDIEIQRTVFSLPLYARYYLEGSRNWRFFPEIGYRLSVFTRERVDIDIDTEVGHDFRLFTARNPTQKFSKLYGGFGAEWQNRGWGFQGGVRWVNQEGVSFHLGISKSLFGKSQSKLWRF